MEDVLPIIPSFSNTENKHRCTHVLYMYIYIIYIAIYCCTYYIYYVYIILYIIVPKYLFPVSFLCTSMRVLCTSEMTAYSILNYPLYRIYIIQ